MNRRPIGGNVLVAGANGAIGSALVSLFLGRPGVTRLFCVTRSPDLPVVDPRVVPIRADLTDDTDLNNLPGRILEHVERLHAVVCATGVLHGPGFGPEKRLEHLDRESLLQLFSVNAMAPVMLLKHLLPLVRHDQPATFAVLSARVGSIGDNRLGGWYGYRMSKAALNMMVKTASIELARRAPNVTLALLHPGTVASPLSDPYARSGRDNVQAPSTAARNLLDVIESSAIRESGQFVDWQGAVIPW